MKIYLLKNKMVKLFLTSLFFAIIFTSCSSSINNSFNKSNDFLVSVKKMVNSSYEKIKLQLEDDDVILVSDFVNIDKLKNHSKLGFLLSETLKNELSSKNIIIKEIELSKNFKLGKHGFNVLSRNSQEINRVIEDEKFAMVGTYSITNRRLILFVKLIDIRTGHILSSSSQSVMIDDEISRLEFKEDPNERRIFQPLTL